MKCDDILEEVRRYLDRLSKKVEVKEAYLFGSTARGDRLRSSDVDLLIISPSVGDMRPDERIRLVHTAWKYRLPADIFILTPAEFEYLRDKSVVLRDASRYWVRVL
ncbi:nucleotidyltransferase domain-containing protein [Candidatus Bathyarchaeota archaeon]|nr:MAG: nucleotidyltransferase domain-containing protein [Candidatus Bathyarchaeota archaeon]